MPSIILNNFSTSFIEAVSLNQTQSLSIDLVSLGSPVAFIHPSLELQAGHHTNQAFTQVPKDLNLVRACLVNALVTHSSPRSLVLDVFLSQGPYPRQPGTTYVAEDDLELLTLTIPSSPWTDGQITAMHHRTKFTKYWRSTPSFILSIGHHKMPEKQVMSMVGVCLPRVPYGSLLPTHCKVFREWKVTANGQRWDFGESD